MRLKIGKKITIYFFILIILGTFNNQKLLELKQFEIKDVIMDTPDNSNFLDILDKISKLQKSSIFLINKNNLKKIIEENHLVENYFIFKNYPSTIKIKIFKTKFLSRLNINGEIFLVGSNGKLSRDTDNSIDLPFIFGNPSIKQILDFNNSIKNSRFNLYEFSNLFYFKSGRWDLETKDGVIIRLPVKNFSKKLEEIFDIVSKENFTNKRIIDARVSDQIILYD